MKKCITCGADFTPKRNPEQKTCSRSCNARYINSLKPKFKPNNCLTCGKELRHLSNLKYCSLKCSGKSKRGEKHHLYKGRKLHSEGYIYLLDREHPFSSKENYILEHRVVVENWLRANNPNDECLIELNGIKYLSPKAVVHHKNGFKADNRIENLDTYISQSVHIKDHSKDEHWFGRNR